MKRKLIKPIDLLVIYDKIKLSGMDIVNKMWITGITVRWVLKFYDRFNGTKLN